MTVVETESFEKINYLLRPSKQVERKLLIEALHRLASLDYRIADYTYVGLGSVYYVDFILFHRYLYIDKMICAESAKIPKRMRFNKPFDFIRVEMEEVAQLIPQLNRDLKYFVWLDYDATLSTSILSDTAGLIHILAPGSILVVTVDAEPRLPKGTATETLSKEELIDRRVAELDEHFGGYYGKKVGRKVFTRHSLPPFYAVILRNQFQEAIAKRSDVGFLQLFNFRYADGAQMLSIGGLIDNEDKLNRVRQSSLFNLDFVHGGPDPITISVPPLTVREKHFLDRIVRTSATCGDLPFELQEQMLQNFRKYYRHYPTYYETLI